MRYKKIGDDIVTKKKREKRGGEAPGNQGRGLFVKKEALYDHFSVGSSQRNGSGKREMEEARH